MKENTLRKQQQKFGNVCFLTRFDTPTETRILIPIAKQINTFGDSSWPNIRKYEGMLYYS